jgi:hypothetical protein
MCRWPLEFGIIISKQAVESDLPGGKPDAP